MRPLLLALLAACGSEHPAQVPSKSDTGVDAPAVSDVPCGGACGAGTTCVAGRCEVEATDVPAVDVSAEDRGGTDAGTPQDAAEDRPVVVDVLMDAGPSCPVGEALCGGRCVNTMTDRDNCGGCNQRCGTGDPARRLVYFCEQGRCMTRCEARWGDCNPTIEGCETELSLAGNCGACGRMCPRTQPCIPTPDGGAFTCRP